MQEFKKKYLGELNQKLINQRAALTHKAARSYEEYVGMCEYVVALEEAVSIFEEIFDKFFNSTDEFDLDE